MTGLLAAVPAPAAVPDSMDPVLRELDFQEMVRVFTESREEPVVGRYTASASAETLLVKPLGLPPVAIARQDVLQLDVSPKRTNATWTGALLGALIGGAATYAVVRANEDSEGPVIFLGFVFVPVGAGWGALVGSGVIDYHWRTVWERP